MTSGLGWILKRTVHWYRIYFSGWWSVPLVFICMTDGERDGLWWSALSGHWLFCTGCCQYLLNVKCLIYGLLFLQLSTSLSRDVSAHGLSFWKRIALVTIDLLYIIFTGFTQDNLQECFRLSNWFSLRRLGPRMNHLPPVWRSNFMFMFLNESWYVSLT